MDSNLIQLVFLQKEEIWTQTQTQGECHENWKVEICKQRMPKTGGKPPELGEKPGIDHPSPPSEETNRADTLFLDF